MEMLIILLLNRTGALRFVGGSFDLIGSLVFQLGRQNTVERASFGFIEIRCV